MLEGLGGEEELKEEEELEELEDDQEEELAEIGRASCRERVWR